MTAPHRVGIVGSGFGGTVHAPAYTLHPAFELVAIASPNRAAAIARERNVPNAFASVEEMLAQIDVDVVSVTSPPFDHHHSVLQALAAGKHVLCEKPFAHTVAQAEEMLAAAERAGTVCAIAHEFRYTPARRATVELIENEHLGPLREIEIVIFSKMLRADATDRGRGWWFDYERGGGIAQAVASHAIDLAKYLAGRRPSATHGFIRTANPSRRDTEGSFTSTVDDGVFALLDFGDGLAGRITVDATLTIAQATVAVHGERRSAVASGDNLIAQTLFTIDDDEQNELELTPPSYAKFASVHPQVPAFLELLDAFADRINGGDARVPSFADGLATQHVLSTLGYGNVEARSMRQPA